MNLALRRRPVTRRSIALSAAACVAIATVVLPAGPALASGQAGQGPAGASPMAWADPSKATLHPGFRLVIEPNDCTANFVFTDVERHVYLGMAAHCVLTGLPISVDGCATGSRPLGTYVYAVGANVYGVLAYSSWLAMQRAKETDRDLCEGNDLALVRLPDEVRELVNPSVPFFGGPTGLNTDGVTTGQAAYGYGTALVKLREPRLAPMRGIVVPDLSDWSHEAYFLPPAIPGDSGGPVLDPGGRALGVMQSLELSGSNGISDMDRALSYARAHAGIKGLRLVAGTAPFSAAGPAAEAANNGRG